MKLLAVPFSLLGKDGRVGGDGAARGISLNLYAALDATSFSAGEPCIIYDHNGQVALGERPAAAVAVVGAAAITVTNSGSVSICWRGKTSTQCQGAMYCMPAFGAGQTRTGVSFFQQVAPI